MAYDRRHGDEFDLDDDGILHDSMAGADDLLMDDDGIMRGTDELDLYKHVTRGHWTDSGIGGDKQSVTSTLKNLQNSFEEDLAPIGDESINISEFEASKDELSEDDFVGGGGGGGGKRNRSKVGASSLDLTDTLGDTLETPRAADDTQGTIKRTSQSDFDKLTADFDNHQLFTPEYYNQLRELGVLVDGADLSRDSLNEFEEIESRVASRAGGELDEDRDLIGEYLESEYMRERMEEEEDEGEEAERKAKRGETTTTMEAAAAAAARVSAKRDAHDDVARIGERERAAEKMKREAAGGNAGRNSGGGRRGADEEDEAVGGMDTPYSRPSSGRTVSSRTFPDDEDYYDDEEEGGDYRHRVNDSQNLGSQGGSQPARMIGDDDDELYYINNRNNNNRNTHGDDSRLRSGSRSKGDNNNNNNNNMQGRPGSGSRSRTPTGGARSRTPVISGSRRTSQSPAGGIYDNNNNNKRQRRFDDNNNDDDDDDDARSFYSESAPYYRSRPSSAASHVSTASENVSARQKRAEQVALQRMSKASKSQESFFEDDHSLHATPRSGGKSSDKHHHHQHHPQQQQQQQQQQQSSSSSSQQPHHKRLLPTPNTSISNVDPTSMNQSFKLKSSKSAGNIAGSSAGPVKPTHMSLSEITRLTGLNTSADDDDSTANAANATDLADKSTGELTDRLTQESQKRKHATELVQQLQLDYDNLLTKYALAELTIDHMRLGAKITVHSDSPTPGQAIPGGVMSPVVGQSPQVVQLRSSPANATSVRASPAQGVLGHVSPLVDSGNQTANVQTGTTGSTSDIRSQGSRLSVGDSEDGLREDAMTETEKVKVDLQTQASGLDEKLESFYSMVENQQLTLEQESGAFEEIRSEHDALRRSYLTAKDDYNILKRSGAFSSDTQQPFDSNKELEGQLFRLGMRFDEVQERVEGNQAKLSPARQPFQQQDSNKSFDRENKKDQVDGRRGSGSHPASPSVLHPNNRHQHHNHSMDSTDGGRITERRVDELRQDYNANMDAYRKLKYADDSSEGQREVDNVVRRLHGICTEMPEMFRLSPEIQSRWENLEKKDKINLADRKNSVWEKLNQREQTMKSQRRSPVPQSPGRRRGGDRASPVDGRPPSILRQTSDSSDMDSLRLRMDGSSRSSLGSILPDRMDRPPSRSDRDRPSSRASNTGYDPDDLNRPGGSRDHNPSLPRPRRHDQRGVRDPKLAAMPNMGGSVGSLPDSGISDQENGSRRRNSHDRAGRQSPAGARGGATGGSNDVLNALPGSPYKKAGKARGADDADSGFLGSMVGSGVGLPPGAPQQQQQQQQQQQDEQRVLRLRRPAEEISTTDQSLDTSDYQARQRSTRSRHKRMQDAASGMTGQSYDGSDDTLEETQEGDTSIERHMGGAKRGQKGGANVKSRRKSDSRDFSMDATLEEEYSEASDVSTPRAVNQMSSKTKERRSSDSKAPPSKERATPRKSSKHQSSSKQQSTSEDEDLKKALELERSRQSKSHRLQQDTSLDESPRQKRLKSPPPALPRPKSRGSPTTDLYKTRERRGSESSVRSRRSVRDEVAREERREPQQSRSELRLNHRGPEIERPGSRQGRQKQNEKPGDLSRDARNSEIADRVRDYESRSSIGSDVEVGSDLTRASSTNSNRLKLLQEEIEKLKEGVAKANEKASQPHPHPVHPHPTYPQPSQQPQQPAASDQPQQQEQQPRRDEPEFYDPFDDPYGFMRMPRRRANSFSGGREREWDEWYWTLPQNRQYDGADIPLGYAAADAYADVLPHKANANTGAAGSGERSNSRENARHRLRQRRMGRGKSRDDDGAGPAAVDQGDAGAGGMNGVGVGVPTALQPPTQAAAGARMNPGTAVPRDDQAMYDYYVPSRYSTQGMRNQMAQQGYFTTPSGAKIYTANGGQQQGPTMPAPNTSSPWYQIRRAARPSFGNTSSSQEALGARMGGRRTQSYDDVRTQPSAYASQTPTASPGGHVVYGPATYSQTQTCPMCGVTADHTHANYTHYATQPAQSQPSQPQAYTSSYQHAIPIYAPETASPSRAGRRRSRSASRSRHYTPERTPRSRSRTRYHVREYDRGLSDSFSDDERMERGRRSRSLTRERSRSRPSSPVRHRRPRRKSRYSGSDDSDSVEDGMLDKSLSLSVDISRLTKKMMGALKGELRRSKDKREFGSSYW